MEKGSFKLNNITKTLAVFLLYFTYTNITMYICNTFGIKYDLSIALYVDCVFMFILVYIYQNNIKADIKNLKENYSLKKILKTIIFTVLIIFFAYLLFTLIVTVFFPNVQTSSDDNTEKIRDLYNISVFYTIFKTLIFGVVAEELLFREAVRDIIKRKWLFIIISVLIYTTINFIYTDFTTKTLLFDIIFKLYWGFMFSITYIKNNSNIVILILIKFVYNLIPLTILLLGL